MYHGKLQVGDTVRVIDNLELGKVYYMDDSRKKGMDVVSRMMFLTGCEVTISEVCDRGYRIKEDNNLYIWTNGMFEDKDETDDFAVSDIETLFAPDCARAVE